MEVVNVVLSKVVDVVFGAAKREFDYVRNCAENVENLRNEVQELRNLKGRVQQRIDIAAKEGDDLVVGVQAWMEKADAEISEADEFLKKEANAKKTFCFNLRLCVNLSTLRHFSRIAVMKVSSIKKIFENGQTYESCVSVPAPTPGFLQLHERKNLDGIETHKLTLYKIIEAILDESKQIIGIYGLGGVGKTTLAKEVAAVVKDLFAEVVFTTVSRIVHLDKMKADLEKAAKRIVKGEKILIILDDIWSHLELEEVGIPCGKSYMNCKILLTSRDRGVCEKMDAQSMIGLDPLLEEEAWLLFKGAAGERVEIDAKLNPIAREIAEECGGLPLIIQVVGKALKNKDYNFWEAAVHQLKNAAPLDIDPEIRKAFLRLELSYNCLESEDAKSCFLLCCLYPEDSNIPIESLALYGVALRKFERLDSLEDARRRVRVAIDTLKSSFLLLDCDSKYWLETYKNSKEKVKMHDVVRDVGLVIASKAKNNFLVKAGVRLTEWLPMSDELKDYTAISLMRNDIMKLPDGLDCSSLNTLLLQKNRNLSDIPDDFFQGMKELELLDLELNDISPLPQSLALVTKLRMLNLGDNRKIKEISALGELKFLEVLILRGTSIEEIPHQIGQLVNLRKLDVKRCRSLSLIARGVLSKLYRLEEFTIGYNVVQWENYNGENQQSNASVVELFYMSRLTVLDLFVPDLDRIPEDGHFKIVKRFFVQIGGDKNTRNLVRRNRENHVALATSSMKISLPICILKLIQVTEGISFHFIENHFKNIMPTLDNEGFNNLKHCYLESCNNIPCLVDTRDVGKSLTFHSLETQEIYDSNGLTSIAYGHLEHNSFAKLHEIRIEQCASITQIVSSNMPHVLQNIRKVVVSECTSVRCIFECKGAGDVGDKEKRILSRLEEIELLDLTELDLIWDCPDHWISFGNLVEFSVGYCNKLTTIFSPKVAQGLVNLKFLFLSGNKRLEEVINGGDEETVRGEIVGEVAHIEKIVFPCLESIDLRNCKKLKCFSSGINCTIEYPSLDYVDINKCLNIETWGYGSQYTPKLEGLRVAYRKDLPLNGPYDINDAVSRRLKDPNEWVSLLTYTILDEMEDSNEEDEDADKDEDEDSIEEDDNDDEREDSDEEEDDNDDEEDSD